MATLPACPEFYLKEYEALRREIDAALTEARALERYVLIACGAVWAWLIQNADKSVVQHAQWAWWIPVLFASLGGVRSWAFGRHFGLIGSYINSLESKVIPNEQRPEGWEHFSQPKAFIGRTATIYWALLLAATVLIAWKH